MKTISAHVLNQMIISKRALYALLVSVLFSLLAGFRVFGMSRDYWGYQFLFESVADGDIDSRLEPAFIFITKLFGSFFPNDFPLFMGMCAFFGLFWKLRLLTLQRYYLLPFLIYFLILLPLHEMTQIRIAMASGFAYWGIYLSIEGKKLSGFLWLVLGALFQYSVLVLLPFVIMPERVFKYPKPLLVLVFGVAPSIILWSFVDSMDFLNPLINNYMAVADENAVNPFSSRNLILICITITGFACFSRLNYKIRPWFLISVMGLGLFYGMMRMPVFAQRLLELTMFSYLIWIPFLPKKPRIAAWSLFILLSCYMFYRMIYLDPLFI